MQRVLVTGATGFVGRHCLEQLGSSEVEVHAVSSRSGPGSNDAGVNWHTADLLDPERVGELVREVRPTHLLHLAWYVDPSTYRTSPLNFAWVEASLRLLRHFAAGGGQRAVMVGTCFEYRLSRGFCTEHETPLDPTTPYGACKASLSSLFESFCATHDISGAWARPFFFFGPHEPREKLLGSVASTLLDGQPARCTHGGQLRDYLHVADVAGGILALLDSDVTGPVNIARGAPTTLRELIDGVARRLGRSDDVHYGAIAAPDDEPPLIVGDVRRISREVGWNPTLNLEAGLDETVEWWRRQHSEENS